MYDRLIAVTATYIFVYLLIGKVRELWELPFVDIGEDGLPRVSNNKHTQKEESAMFLVLLFVILTMAAHWALVAGAVALLFIGGAQDLRDFEVSDAVTIPFFLICCKIGLLNGTIYVSVLVGLFLAYIMDDKESRLFGGADVIIVLGAFAYLGLFWGNIFLVISCISALLYKVCRWKTGKDKKEDRGLPFVPAAAVGFAIVVVLFTRLGKVVDIWQFA